MNQVIAATERQCRGCGIGFITTDARKVFHKKGCGRSKRELHTNEWLLVNKPHFPSEPCLNCGKPVVQYRTRRNQMEARYCSTKCRPYKAPVATWPPITAGAACILGAKCKDCQKRIRSNQTRCGACSDQRTLVLLKLRTRINWLLPRACLNCNEAFNRFDQGGVCDQCIKRAKAAYQIKRKAAIRGATRYDTGISHWTVHQIFNGVCGICSHKTQPPEVWDDWDGKSWMPFAPTVDHIIPVSRAGTHTWDNVQLAHALCNSLKSAR